MDSIYKIKRACYNRSSLTPGSLFAWNSRSSFIRVYLGVDEFGNHLHRVIRSSGRDVCFSVESQPVFFYNHAHVVVCRG